jgi:type I restriction enzyme S subunit
MKTFNVSSVSAVSLRALNYSPIADRLRRSKRATKRLGDCVVGLGNSLNRVTRVECDPDWGVRLLGQADTYALEPQGKWVRPDVVPSIERLKIAHGDLLLAGAGQVGETTLFGRPVIADRRLAESILGGDTLVLRSPDRRQVALLFAFLLSPTGRQLLVSTAYGTSIPRIHLTLVAELPVPEFDTGTATTLTDLVSLSVKARESYAQRMGAARERLERRPEMHAALTECRDRVMRAGTWSGPLLGTLGAWNYMSPGRALALLRDSWKTRLSDWLESDGWFYGLLRQRTPCDPSYGFPLITQRDVLSIRPLPTWIADPGVPRRSLFSEPGTVVMAGRGTLGENELFARPAAITPFLSRFALTQDLVRLVPKFEYRGPTFVFLSTLVGRRLLRTAAVGTKILQLRKDLQLALPVPDLLDSDVEAINDDYDAAVRAFDDALEAEQRIVDIIEQEVLPRWLV